MPAESVSRGGLGSLVVSTKRAGREREDPAEPPALKEGRRFLPPLFGLLLPVSPCLSLAHPSSNAPNTRRYATTEQIRCEDFTKTSTFPRKNSAAVRPEACWSRIEGRSASSPTREREAVERERPMIGVLEGVPVAAPIAEPGLEWRGLSGEAARLLDRERGVPLREL